MINEYYNNGFEYDYAELLKKMEGDNSNLSPTDKHIRERLYGTGPRAFIEELYYTGLVKGVDKKTGASLSHSGPTPVVLVVLSILM